MVADTDDARFFVDRVKEVAERLDSIAEKATNAGVKMLDGLNQHTVKKSVSALENLCAELEARLERLQNMRRTG
jgi:DNA-binding ferritin-like protein